jgi:hypothetical protein
MNDPNFLDEVSGLAELKNDDALDALVCDWESDDDSFLASDQGDI